MARTLPRWTRFYQNGYNLCPHTRSIGPFTWDAEFQSDRGLCWEMYGGLLGQESHALGQLNTITDVDVTDATLSPHDWIKGWDGDTCHIMIPIGIAAAPTVGDPTVMTVLKQRTSATIPGEGGQMYTTTIDYEPAIVDTDYSQPWGKLIHAYGAETAANSAVGYDDAAATTAGGWMMVQLFAVTGGAGTVTIKLQDAAVNNDGSFADVTDLTTGALAFSAAPTSGVYYAATGATIRRYLRWQIVLAGGATGATFALSFVRGR